MFDLFSLLVSSDAIERNDCRSIKNFILASIGSKMLSLRTPSHHVKEIMREALEARNESLRLAEEYIIAEGLDQIERTLKFINELNPETVHVDYLKELCNHILSSSDKILFVKPLLYVINKVYKEEDLTKISNSFYFQLIQSVSNLLGVSAEEIFEDLDVDEIADNFDYDSIQLLIVIIHL